MATKILVTPFSLSDGTPATGIASGTVHIRDTNSGELLVNSGALIEVGDGFYKFVFTEYTSSINYTIRFDGTSALGASRYTFAANDHHSFDLWEEPMNAHTGSVFASGSVTPLSSSGQMLNFIKDIEGGRWRIDISTNQMVFFKDDNSTIVAVYDLFNSASVADTNNVFERRRVR